MYDGVPITMPIVVRLEVSMRAMQQTAGRTGLVLESGHRLLDQVGVDQVLAHSLDRDSPLDPGIEGLVYDAHRTLAENAVDAVFADFAGVSHACPVTIT